jgi:hypothetical protein
MSEKKMWIDGEEINRQELAKLAIKKGIPEHCADSLAGYITRDYKNVGGFLTALLSNNLKATFAMADDKNIGLVYNYLKFLYNYAPAGCWGSMEKVENWIQGE